MSFFFDASLILPTIVREPATPVVDEFIDSIGETPQVSEFTAAEVASALSRLVRMGQLAEDDALGRLADFDAWCGSVATLVEVESSDVRLAGIIVRRFDLKLRTPDALHVACCRRLGATLATLDRRLAAAARDLGVAVALL